MPTLPIAEWTAALDTMTTAVSRALAELDRHQAAWVTLTDMLPASASGLVTTGRLEARLDHWDERLNRAAKLASEVEYDLEERTAAVNRWHEAFACWRELLQKQMGKWTISPR